MSTVWKFPVKRYHRTGEIVPGGVFNASQVSQFMQCPRCFEMAYVEDRERKVSCNLVIGGTVHRAVEEAVRLRRADPEAKVDVALGAAEAEFAHRSKTEGEMDCGKFKTPEAVKDEAMRLARFAADHLTPIIIERGLIEAEFSITDFPEEALTAAFPFWQHVRSHLDFLYDDGFSDLKTKTVNAGPGQDNSLQFAFYALPLYCLGINPKIRADMLIKQVTPQLTTYYANGTGYMTDEQFIAARDTIIDVAERITRGDYPVGTGYFGRHDYDHGLPAFSVAVQGFAA